VPFVFGDFELDDELFELRKDGARVPLRPQALDVLLYLARAQGRVVTKQELIAAVWGGARVSETALPQTIAAMRRALEDDADEPKIIQTVRARGYRFAAPIAGRTRPPSAPRLGGAAHPLVGREELVARVCGLLQLARGQVLLLTGDPGAGKTRALAEIGALARDAGARAIGARCEEGGAPDLWPWMQVLRALAPADAEAVFSDATEDGRFRVFDAAVRMLAEAARRSPLVILLDDVQWADASSLLLFKLASQSLAEARVLLVAAYREAAVATNPVLARTLGALTREDPARMMRLSPLGKREVESLARAILERDPEPALVDRVHAKTAGNPLFVTQLLHVIRSERWLAPLEEGATSAMLDADEVREAVGLHLGELSPECRRVLSAASVLGPSFALSALAPMVALEPAHALAVLDEALRARVVAKGDAPATFRFLHTLVRDVLYKKLAAADRVRLHEAAARAYADLALEGEAAAHRAKAAQLIGA
jgi:predicted ATPase/DNA-binding winged helix-turn-helix (wHTH) protein